MRLVPLLLAIGCSTPHRDPQNGGGDGSSATCADTLDIVFVLDVSSSMGFVLDQLGEQIGQVASAASTIAPDPHFGLVAFVDNDRLDLTGQLEGGKVHLLASSLQAAFAYYKENYEQDDRNPGDPIDGPAPQNPLCEENSVDALYDAATAFPWRDNATRVVIVATDDTFLDVPDNYGDRDGDGLITHTSSSDFPYTEGNYPARHSLAETEAALKSQRIRVFSFTADGTNGTCGRGQGILGYSRYPAADIPNGWTQPAFGQPPIPVATSGANFNLAQVEAGTRSLADTINQVVLDSHCNVIFE